MYSTQTPWLTFGALAALLSGMLLLSGCATLNKEECLNADWRIIGFEDGARGHAASRIGNHRKACSEHGVIPDATAYNAGRDEGLKEFCQPQNGYRLGLRGRTYAGVCPRELESQFVDAYNYGKKIHGIERQISSKEYELKQREKSLEETRTMIKTKEAMLIRDNVPAHQRMTLLTETKELSKQEGTLEAEIVELGKAIAQLRGNVHQLKLNSQYQ